MEKTIGLSSGSLDVSSIGITANDANGNSVRRRRRQYERTKRET